MIRRLLVLLGVLLAGGAVALAQVPPIGNTQSISSATTSYTWTLTPGQSTCAFSVAGTWSGATLTFTVSVDNVNFAKAPPDSANTLLANGLLNVTCASYRYVKVSESGITGTALVTLSATGAGGASAQGSGGGGNVVITAPTDAAGRVIVVTPAPAQAVPTNAAGQVITAIASPVAGGAVVVTTPAPLPSNANGVLVAQGTAGNLNATVITALSGANNPGTAGGAGQGRVAMCNYTTSPGTISSGNINPLQCDTKGNLNVNINALAGSATATTGLGTNISAVGGATGIPNNGTLPATPTWPTNAAGGGCAGYTVGASAIARSTLVESVTANLALTQIVALTASKVIHICSVLTSWEAVTTTGNISLSYGTGSNCASGNTYIYTVVVGTGTAGGAVSIGNGESGIYDTASANELCVSSSFTGGTAIVTLTYAQY